MIVNIIIIMFFLIVTWHHIGKDLIEGAEIEIGEWGIHWSNWSQIDKSNLLIPQIKVEDSNGHIIYESN